MRDGLERVMDMKKRLGGRRQILSAFLPVLAAAALLSGCQRENPAAVTEVSEESQEESRETEQNSEAGTDASAAETSSGDEKGEDGGWVENIMLGTDIHYFSDSLTDGGPRFQEMVEYGDGKVVTYIDQITDAFLDEVVKLRPDALVLSGDLTLNGEKASHKDLAEKLHRFLLFRETMISITARRRATRERKDFRQSIRPRRNSGRFTRLLAMMKRPVRIRTV